MVQPGASRRICHKAVFGQAPRFVRMSVYLPRNARTLIQAKQLGGTIKFYRRARSMPVTVATALIRPRLGGRGEYWANKAGCGHMITRPDDERTSAPRS